MAPHRSTSKPTATSLPDTSPLTDAEVVISTNSLTILTPEGSAPVSESALGIISEHTGQNAQVLMPTALFLWAQANREELIGAAITGKIVAIAVGVTPVGQHLPPSAAHWILWADVGWRQYQFAYNLALETGVEVHIRPALAAPPEHLLERPVRRTAPSPLQPASRSNSPLPSATPLFKQGLFGPTGRQGGSRPRTPQSRNDENTPPRSFLHPNLLSLDSSGPSRRRTNSRQSAQPSPAPHNVDLARAAQAPAPPAADARPVVAPGIVGPTIPGAQHNASLPPGAQAPRPAPASPMSVVRLPRMAPLPSPFIGPLADEDIAIDPSIKKTSRISAHEGDTVLAQSILSHKRAQLRGEGLINASLYANLSYARPLVELERGFLAVDSNGLPHSVFCQCQNPIPLGTDKIITKNSKTNTVGGTLGIAGAAVAASATAAVALGKEDTKETQLLATTSYISTNCSNRITGMTFEITPFLRSDSDKDRRSATAQISVDLNCGVHAAAPEQRGEGYILPLRLTAQWHLRKHGDSSRFVRKNQIGFSYALIHEATEDVWGGNWDQVSETESIVAWADAAAHETITGLDFPILIRQGDTGPSRVFGLKSRLTPNEKGRWLRTLLRRLIPSRLKSRPVSRIRAGAYKLWGRAGWMALDVEPMFRIPSDGDLLDSEGAIVLGELDVKCDPVLSFRQRRGTL
ncbi:hypothetical protein C8R46DRAFT_1106489 [Mycena filopes]|nr:hypothetical protein C8R46DRAFT_1106489 [Mycena filopes]